MAAARRASFAVADASDARDSPLWLCFDGDGRVAHGGDTTVRLSVPPLIVADFVPLSLATGALHEPASAPLCVPMRLLKALAELLVEMERTHLVLCDWHTAQVAFTVDDFAAKLIDYDALHDVSVGNVLEGSACGGGPGSHTSKSACHKDRCFKHASNHLDDVNALAKKYLKHLPDIDRRRHAEPVPADQLDLQVLDEFKCDDETHMCRGYGPQANVWGFGVMILPHFFEYDSVRTAVDKQSLALLVQMLLLSVRADAHARATPAALLDIAQRLYERAGGDKCFDKAHKKNVSTPVVFHVRSILTFLRQRKAKSAFGALDSLKNLPDEHWSGAMLELDLTTGKVL